MPGAEGERGHHRRKGSQWIPRRSVVLRDRAIGQPQTPRQSPGANGEPTPASTVQTAVPSGCYLPTSPMASPGPGMQQVSRDPERRSTCTPATPGKAPKQTGLSEPLRNRTNGQRVVPLRTLFGGGPLPAACQRRSRVVGRREPLSRGQNQSPSEAGCPGFGLAAALVLSRRPHVSLSGRRLAPPRRPPVV